MDFDGESLDMLEDVMDVDVGNPLDDSNIMLELNNEGTNDGNYQNRTEENEDEDEEEEEDDDDSNSPSAVDGDPNAADKREKSNAKAVECLDLDGNLIEIFKSGLAASVKLNIPQGDISQCCRGLKRSVAGYRFRFHGDTEDRSEFKLKRGYGYVLEPVIPAAKEPQAPAAPTRNTRASRGEYSLNSQVAQERNTDGYKALAAIKTRQWKQEFVDVGPFLIKKWLPNHSVPTAALQELKMKAADQKKSSRRLSKKPTIPTTNYRTRGTLNYMNNVMGENFEE